MFYSVYSIWCTSSLRTLTLEGTILFWKDEHKNNWILKYKQVENYLPSEIYFLCFIMNCI